MLSLIPSKALWPFVRTLPTDWFNGNLTTVPNNIPSTPATDVTLAVSTRALSWCPISKTKIALVYSAVNAGVSKFYVQIVNFVDKKPVYAAPSFIANVPAGTSAAHPMMRITKVSDARLVLSIPENVNTKNGLATIHSFALLNLNSDDSVTLVSRTAATATATASDSLQPQLPLLVSAGNGIAWFNGTTSGSRGQGAAKDYQMMFKITVTDDTLTAVKARGSANYQGTSLAPLYSGHRIDRKGKVWSLAAAETAAFYLDFSTSSFDDGRNAYYSTSAPTYTRNIVPVEGDKFIYFTGTSVIVAQFSRASNSYIQSVTTLSTATFGLDFTKLTMEDVIWVDNTTFIVIAGVGAPPGTIGSNTINTADVAANMSSDVQVFVFRYDDAANSVTLGSNSKLLGLGLSKQTYDSMLHIIDSATAAIIGTFAPQGTADTVHQIHILNSGVVSPFDSSLWSQFSFSENLFIDDVSDTIVLPTSATLSKYKMTNTDANVAALDKIPPVYFGASEDFTIEGWCNLSGIAAYGGALLTIDNLGIGGDGNRSFMLAIALDGSRPFPYFFISSTGNTPTPGSNQLAGNTTLALNTDIHVAVCRKNGVVTMYANGAPVGSVADTTAGYRSAEFMSVRRGAVGKRWGMRVLRGKAAYNGAFTPVRPQLPLAQYYDAATQKDIVFQACMRRNALINEANGQPINLAGSASVAYGRLTTTAVNSSRFTAYCPYFGAGDFTIECKVRLPSAPATTQSAILGQWGVGTSPTTCSWMIQTLSSAVAWRFIWQLGSSQYSITSSVNLPINSDVHIVIECVDRVITVYMDGVSVGTANLTAPLQDISNIRQLRNNWDDTTQQSTLQVTNIRIAKRAMYKGVIKPSSTFPRMKPANTGPGPQELKFGTPYCGYYGQVSEAELLGTADLASLVGITQGTKVAAPIWLKFASNGKIIFTPKGYIRDACSWQAIYQAGCVYGLDSGTGLSPSGTAVQQTKKVQLLGSTFKVRLMRGANANPYPGASGEYNIQDPDASQNSEWSTLMYRVWANDPLGAYWEKFSSAELGVQGNRLTFCQETHPYGTDYRVERGFSDVPGIAASVSAGTSGGGYTSVWKPVLEFVASEINVIQDGVISGFESVGVVAATPASDGVRFAAGTYLKAVSPPEFAVGTGDFTFELEFTLKSFYDGGNSALVPFVYWGVFAAPGQSINYEFSYNNTAKTLSFSATHDAASTNDYKTAPCTLLLNTPYKLQVTRDAGMLQFWVNGTKLLDTAYAKDLMMTVNTPFYIGRRIGGSSGNVNWWADMTMKTFRFVTRGLSKL